MLSKTTGKRNGPWVRSFAEARSWRVRALASIDAGLVSPREEGTLRDDWRTFYAGACAGTIPGRTGKPHKPATLRGYERGWRKIDPVFGASRASEIRRVDVQAMVDDGRPAAWRRQRSETASIRSARCIEEPWPAIESRSTR